MAIYHCSAQAISRSNGDSVVAAAAYRARATMRLELTGEQHRYERKQSDLLHSEVITPANAKQYSNAEELWNAVENKEVRKSDGLVKQSAELGREWEIALPVEFTDNQNVELAQSITQWLVDRYGFGAQCSVHFDKTKQQPNPHVHILASSRRLDENGVGNKVRELSAYKTKRQELEAIREQVATQTNNRLEKYGFEARVDHRSLEAQQEEAENNGDYTKAFELSREPTKHIGKKPEKQQNIEHNKKVEADNYRRYKRLIKKIETDTVKEYQENQKAQAKQQEKQEKKEPVKQDKKKEVARQPQNNTEATKQGWLSAFLSRFNFKEKQRQKKQERQNQKEQEQQEFDRQKELHRQQQHLKNKQEINQKKAQKAEQESTDKRREHSPPSLKKEQDLKRKDKMRI